MTDTGGVSHNLEFLQKRMKTYDDMERSMKRVEASFSHRGFFGCKRSGDNMPTRPHSSLDSNHRVFHRADREY